MEERIEEKAAVMKNLLAGARIRVDQLEEGFRDLLNMDPDDIEDEFGDIESWKQELEKQVSRIDTWRGKVDAYEDAVHVINSILHE